MGIKRKETGNYNKRKPMRKRDCLFRITFAPLCRHHNFYRFFFSAFQLQLQLLLLSLHLRASALSPLLAASRASRDGGTGPAAHVADALSGKSAVDPTVAELATIPAPRTSVSSLPRRSGTDSRWPFLLLPVLLHQPLLWWVRAYLLPTLWLGEAWQRPAFVAAPIVGPSAAVLGLGDWL